MKSDVIDGSIVSGLEQPILPRFVLNKPPGYKVFCDSETIFCIKTNKPVLNTITFYSEDYNHREDNFNGETLKFTLQLIKI